MASQSDLVRHNRPHRMFRLNVLLVLGLAVALRCLDFAGVPAINGDEAWYGVQAERFLQGAPVAWRTPTGNPLNPFYFLPLLALHALAPPSPAVLRGVALLSGLLALPANWYLCRRAFDERTAIASTVLLAVLPVNLAYARLGWDASQTLLCSLPVLYLPWIAARSGHCVRYYGLAALAQAAAVLVHPTNVFLAPLWVWPLWRRCWPQWQVLHRTRPRVAGSVSVVAACLALGAVWLIKHWLFLAAGRLLALDQWGLFGVRVLRLYTGPTVYEYLTGAAEGVRTSIGGRTFELGWWDLLAALGALACTWAWRRAWGAQATSTDRSLAVAVGWTCGGFYLVAGPEALVPHFERYGLCLVAPLTLLLARPWGWPSTASARLQRQFATWGLAVAALFLVSFHVQGLARLQGPQALPHRAFRVAGGEPKAAALEHILRASPGAAPVFVLADEWWTYWPLAYLGSRQPTLHVVSTADASVHAEWSAALAAGRVWHVAFEGVADWESARELLDCKEDSVATYVCRDAGQRPLLWLRQVRRPAAQKGGLALQPK